jgi:hypothetical protein
MPNLYFMAYDLVFLFCSLGYTNTGSPLGPVLVNDRDV